MSCFPKGSREKRKAPTPKRKFHDNQYTVKKPAVGPSATARKLYNAGNEEFSTFSLSYRIIEIVSFFSALTDLVMCRTCHGQIQFKESALRGLGFEIDVECGYGSQTIDSGPIVNTGYEISRRIILVFRVLGIGLEGLNDFCGLMDMGSSFGRSSYYSVIERLHTCAKTVFNTMCSKAVKEEKEEDIKREKAADNLIVSGDGTWKKRGFSSLFGIATLIAKFTGKIVDLVVKSRYCQECTFWSTKEDTPVHAA